MGDPDINEFLAQMDPNGKTLPDNSPVKINYRPIVVPGLVYRTIITGGFLQLMTNDQYSCAQFNNMLKGYENQRQEAIEYLRKEAGKVTSKRLVVPSEVFLQWMTKGCIDLETYVVLRNCVLKKSYKKRMALRKELDHVRTMLAPIGKATSSLIEKIDVKDYASTPVPPPVLKESKISEVPGEVAINKSSIQFMCNPFHLMSTDFFCLPEDSDAKNTYKQALCGMMFGLLAAKVVCTFLLRIISPKETISIT